MTEIDVARPQQGPRARWELSSWGSPRSSLPSGQAHTEVNLGDFSAQLRE
jgi:hypothetical protein